jgi:hypothetical protein
MLPILSLISVCCEVQSWLGNVLDGISNIQMKKSHIRSNSDRDSRKKLFKWLLNVTICCWCFSQCWDQGAFFFPKIFCYFDLHSATLICKDSFKNYFRNCSCSWYSTTRMLLVTWLFSRRGVYIFIMIYHVKYREWRTINSISIFNYSRHQDSFQLSTP